MGSQHGTTRGAVPLGQEGGKRGGVLKWLLPLLLLAAIVIALILLLGGDDDEGSSSSSSSGTASAVEAGGTALLPAKPGSLEPLVGETATGTGAKVVAVNRRNGFWVGTSESDRVYFEYGPGVGPDERGSFVPKTGQTVDVRGPVKPAPADPAKTLNLSAADAQLVTEQGGFVNAASVKPAG